MSRFVPHILELAVYGEPYVGEDADRWDYAELTCPHHPPTALMPCAIWVLCGCPTKPEEITDQDWGTGTGPCPHSATGQHAYIEGEPNHPTAECWALPWASEISDAAFELGLPPGSHHVHPRWVNGSLQLELVDEPEVT